MGFGIAVNALIVTAKIITVVAVFIFDLNW